MGVSVLRRGGGERPAAPRPEFPRPGLLEGKVSASYALKVGRPNYSSEEISLSVSFPVFGAGPEGLEAQAAAAHAGAVLVLEARVHDLFAEIEARRTGGKRG